ncbi:3'(2'),5'-bisphosphate nucleotidase CysQ [Prochlorococcus marinus str. MU1402]|uniref:3'(2'),5'-bisphosphate nucleotidase CysQ n=1 Tax=Prochlorococcus marinus TaxID=1219 RepID=UPI001ADC5636|nr:3'(2'),5'-bisphosphate nucleotidase CysQ [Prochlorococcus marinus XMU1402]MBW3057070.1 3'(2'),5'-bisphosphate nucleotidase CysQ [Prochlorococcus marinus str. MU1402]
MFKLPIGVDIHNLIDDLRVFSWEASDILLHYSKILKNPNYAKEIINIKDDSAPVTAADLAVNDLIIKRINKNYKGVDWHILSEENVKIVSDNSDVNSKWMWVLDPLDGTKDFIQGTENYAMHLALNYEKKPCIGVVLIPEKEELWITDNENVWCENKDGLTKKATHQNNKPLREKTIVTSKNHRNATLSELINKVGFKRVNVMGSIGCKVASILRGESDIYISCSLPGKSSPKDWDFAAPEAILRAAGGEITNIDNKELCYGTKNYHQGGIIIASNNNQTHENLCLQIKEIIMKNDLYPFDS